MVDAMPRSLLGSDFAGHNRALMKLINDVRATGSSADVSLPSIVVIGNQSSGKSSLIEAFSEIRLPRASGTCTRCPTEVRLQHTIGPWECQVKLRREVDEYGNAFVGMKEVNFGNIIRSSKQVEDCIRRAQLAILNPSVDYQRFVDYKLPKEPEKLPLGSKRQYSFSRNVVCLEISGSTVPDLTVIDLPGLIKNVTEGDDPDSIVLIEKLVKENIKNDCLILLTITMKDDYNNQSAAMLAKEADPKGLRTIGVMTKADTVSLSDSKDWVRMLNGEKDKLFHGYYVTRQPNTEELEKNIDFGQAREKEITFFRDNAPWNGLDQSRKKRLGTRNLTDFLSAQLSKFIFDKLPGLIKQINEGYDEAHSGLQKMPAAPSEDAASEMLGLITEFQRITRGYIYGELDKKGLIQVLNAAYAIFMLDMKNTCPAYIPLTKPEIEDQLAGEIKKGRFHLIANIDQIISNTESPEEPASGEQGAPILVYDLDDMREKIQLAMTRQLPGNVPFDVKIALIHEAQSSWRQVVLNTFEKIRPRVEEHCEKCRDLIANRFNDRRATVKRELQVLAERTSQKLLELLDRHKEPFTQNVQYLTSVSEKVFVELRESRYPKARKLSKDDKARYTREALGALGSLGYECTEKDLERVRAPTGWESELKVMADVRAYFQVAFKRIIDDVPQTIDTEYVRPLAKAIYDALLRDLSPSGLEGRHRCELYLAEDPQIKAQRSDLLEKKKRLEAARDAVYRFGMPGRPMLVDGGVELNGK